MNRRDVDETIYVCGWGSARLTFLHLRVGAGPGAKGFSVAGGQDTGCPAPSTRQEGVAGAGLQRVFLEYSAE